MYCLTIPVEVSPSSRGRGLKSNLADFYSVPQLVALFTRAWIEIEQTINVGDKVGVALFTRAWIEINTVYFNNHTCTSRPLHEGVD